MTRLLILIALASIGCDDDDKPDLGFIPDLSAAVDLQGAACTPGMGRTLQGRACATDGQQCAGACDTCGAGLYTVNQYACNCLKNGQGELRWSCLHGDCFNPCDVQVYTDSQCQVRTVCTDGGVWLRDGG